MKTANIYGPFCLGLLAFAIPQAARADRCTSWIQIASGEPSARDRMALAADLSRNRIVLHGGGNLGTVFHDTWELHDGYWELRSLSGPGSVGASMAFDEARGVCVLFGGGGDNPPTFEWDGDAWATRSIPGPGPGVDKCMAYDAARRKVVLFNGGTWEYDGAWLQRPGVQPPNRFAAAMAYDRRRERIVMFGGYDSTALGDTWEWDGTEWTLAATTGPSPRHYHAMCYDERQQRVVTFGGSGGSDTWSWDGRVWSRLPVSASQRGGHGMAFDPQSRKPIAYGGYGYLSDTVRLKWCVSDFNRDGCADPDDLSDYIGCFFNPPCSGADFNGDGNVDPDDLSDFIAAFFEGCS